MEHPFAAIMRNFLLYDHQFVWQQALIFRQIYSKPSARVTITLGLFASKRKYFFALPGTTIWQFFPEYIPYDWLTGIPLLGCV
jgi:hypothetical protein